MFHARKIEDKLTQHQLELRPFHLMVNLSNLHGNCEQPSCYSSCLVVSDHTLPAKGVAYRLPRSGSSSTESPPKPNKADVNVSLAFDFELQSVDFDFECDGF